MKYLVITLVFSLSATLGMAQNSEPIVQISTTYGNIKVKLYNETPIHRDNFLELAKEGKYDGSVFHRVMNRFMIQGGGSPNLQTIDGRPTLPAEINPKFIHKKGALAAARQADQFNPERKSSGSQFYIVHGNVHSKERMAQLSQRSGVTYTEEQLNAYATVGGAPHLDGQYTVYGEVIEGLEVVDAIAAVQTLKMLGQEEIMTMLSQRPDLKGQADRPVEDIIMSVKVIKE